MYLNDRLGCLAILSVAGGAFSHPYHTEWNEYAHKNTTRSASSTQAPITSDLKSSARITSGPTTIGTSSAQPATSTISGGETVVAIIGATYIAGAGGATLMVGGTVHTLGAETENLGSSLAAGFDIRPLLTDPHIFGSTPFVYHVFFNRSPTPYIILTSQNSTKEEVQIINRTLAQEATPNSLSEVTSDRTGLVVFFKAAKALLRQMQSASSLVAGVTPDEKLEGEQPPNSSAPPALATHHVSATGPPGSPKTSLPNPPYIRLQSNALDELKVISQPAGASLADLPGYGYPAEAGKGVAIYVIDTGPNAQNTACNLRFESHANDHANANRKEWTGMPGKSSMYTPGATQEETDFLNHGSCIASKAGGPEYGTAKDADMIAVKLPSDLLISAIFTALVEISNDVFQKNLAGKAVINVSLGSRIPYKARIDVFHTLTSDI